MSSLAASDPASIQISTLRRTVAVVDMVGYGHIAKILEDNLGAASVAELNRQIQGFMNDALATLPDQEAFCVISRPGDGILVLFDRAADAHAFSRQVHLLAKEHTHQRSETTAQRWFRIGVATGDVTATVCTALPPEYAGITIANAVRLETAAHPGEIVIDTASYEVLPAELKLLYGKETTARGKREETFRVRRYQVTRRLRQQVGPASRLFNRRIFFSGAASLAGGAALAAWLRPEIVDPVLHPLPAKRFVALLGWPAPTDTKLKSTLAAVVNAISDELIRAEAFDRNLLILPYNSSQMPTTLAELNEIRESLGANLVLAASGVPKLNQLYLNLRVLGFAPSHSLRETMISVPMDQQLTLPEKAVQAAGRLLNVSGFRAEKKRSSPGTASAEAFAAFQAAEQLRKEDNDASLDKAIDQYKQAIDLDPKYAEAHARLAVAYCRFAVIHHDAAGLTLARENAETAATLDPASVSAHMALAGVYDETGDVLNAFEEMKKALAADPSNTQTLIWQADIYDRLNRWQDAENAFERVIKARPNNWIAHNQLGAVYYDQGKYRLALREFESASLLAPRSTFALSNIGIIHLELGDLTQAQANCQKSYNIRPTALAAGSLAVIARVQSDLTTAVSFAQQATSLDSDEGTAWLELGDCYSLIPGKKHLAAAAYEQARQVQEAQVSINPNSGPGLMLLALYQVKCNPAANVNPLVARADAMPAGDMDSQLTKTRILELTHQRDKALGVLKQCLSSGATRFQVESIPDLKGLLSDPAYHAIAV